MLNVRRRGFSFAEIVVVIGLLAIGLGITLTSLNRPTTRQGPEALAKVFAEELKLARAEAISTGKPVGVALPAPPDTNQASSQSYYVLRGENTPQIVRVRQTDSDFPGAYLTYAAWGPGTILTGTPYPEFDSDRWGHPFPKDPTLIFLPSGDVTSNHLAYNGLRYQVLISSGVGTVSDTFGSPPENDRPFNHRVLEASNARTVTVSIGGQINVYSGVHEDDSLRRESSPQPAVSVPPGLTSGSEEKPVIVSLETGTPELVEMPPDGNVTFSVSATAPPQGGTLFVEWTGPGSFSSVGPTEMTWNPISEQWEHTVEFLAANPLADATVTATVTSSQGQASSGTVTAAAAGGGQLLLAGRVDVDETKLYSSLGSANSQLLLLSPSGESKQVLATWPGTKGQSYLSPLGQEFLLHVDDTLQLGSVGSGIVRELASDVASDVQWSSDGTRFAYQASDMSLVVRSVDGSTTATYPRPNGNLVKFTPALDGYITSKAEPVVPPTVPPRSATTLRLWTFADSSSNVRLTDGRASAIVDWSRESGKLLFLDTDLVTREIRIWVCSSDGTNKRKVATQPPRSGSAMLRWGPDEKYFAVAFRTSSATGGIDIYHEDTGFVSTIPSSQGTNLLVGPTWMSSTELVYGLDGFRYRTQNANKKQSIWAQIGENIMRLPPGPEGGPPIYVTVPIFEIVDEILVTETAQVFRLQKLWRYNVASGKTTELADIPPFQTLDWSSN